jgi:hypothetical protein
MSETFESWAIVELFGHQRIAGRVSEEQLAGTSFLRVDVPETHHAEPFTRFYGASAIYAVTPVEEAIAKRAAEQSMVWVPMPKEQPALPAYVVEQEDDLDFDEEPDDFA